MAQDVSSRQLIVAGTRLGPVPLVPEIRLHQASDPISLWQRTEDSSGRTGLDVPGQRITEDTDIKHTTIWTLAERPDETARYQQPLS